jgi:hypothetical protein
MKLKKRYRKMAGGSQNMEARNLVILSAAKDLFARPNRRTAKQNLRCAQDDQVL